MGEKPHVWGPEHGGQGEAGGAGEARARPLQPLRSRRSWSCTATAWPAWRACALTRLLPFSTWGWATTNCWAPPRAAMSPENTGNVGPRVGGGGWGGGSSRWPEEPRFALFYDDSWRAADSRPKTYFPDSGEDTERGRGRAGRLESELPSRAQLTCGQDDAFGLSCARREVEQPLWPLPVGCQSHPPHTSCDDRNVSTECQARWTQNPPRAESHRPPDSAGFDFDPLVGGRAVEVEDTGSEGPKGTGGPPSDAPEGSEAGKACETRQ